MKMNLIKTLIIKQTWGYFSIFIFFFFCHLIDVNLPLFIYLNSNELKLKLIPKGQESSSLHP